MVLCAGRRQGVAAWPRRRCVFEVGLHQRREAGARTGLPCAARGTPCESYGKSRGDSLSEPWKTRCKHSLNGIEVCCWLNQREKFIRSQTRLPQNSAQCSCIHLLVIRYYHLCERFVPAQYDVAAVLPFNLKTCFAKSRDTSAPRGPRQLGHTASKTASNRSGGIGKPSC